MALDRLRHPRGSEQLSPRAWWRRRAPSWAATISDTSAYDGACPPPGSGAHHYQFKVWALSTPSLPDDAAAKGETIGPYLEAHALASATLTATYER